MFNALVAIGVILLLVFLLVLIISWIVRAPFVYWVSKHSTLLLRVIFIGAIIGSVIYSEYFLYPPCVLCWYQRLAIFPIGILSLTGSLRTNKLLQNQVLLLASLGFIVALFHNYLDIFQPAGLDVCGADGVSCSARYVYEFGFVTIPLMSGAVLLAGILITLIAKRFPQN